MRPTSRPFKYAKANLTKPGLTTDTANSEFPNEFELSFSDSKSSNEEVSGFFAVQSRDNVDCFFF